MLDPEMKNTKDFCAFSVIRHSEDSESKQLEKALFIIEIFLKTTLFPLLHAGYDCYSTGCLNKRGNSVTNSISSF